MRLLFRDGTKAADEHKTIDFMMVNQDRQILVDPLEDLVDEEKLAVMTDLMNADPIQNELNVVSQRWSEVTSFWGGKCRENLNGYDTVRHRVVVEAQVRQKRKIDKKFDQTYDEYFSPVQHDS